MRTADMYESGNLLSGRWSLESRMPGNGAPCHAQRQLPPHVVGVQGYVLRGERANLDPKRARGQEHAVKRNTNEDM